MNGLPATRSSSRIAAAPQHGQGAACAFVSVPMVAGWCWVSPAAVYQLAYRQAQETVRRRQARFWGRLEPSLN